MAYTFRGEPGTQSRGARSLTRSLRAARRRVILARSKAERHPTPENLEAVTELEAGLARLERTAMVAA